MVLNKEVKLSQHFPQRWQYKRVITDLSKVSEELKTLGADNWELISVIHELPYLGMVTVHLYLKRPEE